MSTKGKLFIALVGYGYWGPNLLRNFKNSSKFKLKSLIERDPKILQTIKDSDLGLIVYDSLDEALMDDELDCIAIATPPQSHYEVAKKCLLKGKHILIEKPFTTSFEKAKELTELAEERNLEIMVDYTFLYHGAVQSIKEVVDNKTKFGDLLYIDSVRINLGIFQSDVNVVWDLACHDISIFNYLLNEVPVSVQAIGIDGLGNGIENIAYIHLKYKNRFAHINCSWSSPVKIRTMLLGGTRQAILYNDIEPTDKIKVYNKGVVFAEASQRKELLQDYRTGEVNIPKYDTTEALKSVVDSFHKVVVDKKENKSSAKSALLVLYILEMVQKSIHLNGKEINIDWKQLGPSLYSYITNKGML